MLTVRVASKTEAQVLQSSSIADDDQGRSWSPGVWARFPILSLICLSIIIGSGVGSVTVLLVSENQDVDSWCSGQIYAKALAGADGKYSYRITVGAWIALFVFLAGKSLAVMFAEALTVSWWVAALKGQSLDGLHFRWQAGQSIFDALSKPRFFGWIVIASITFTAFTGLETLLQNASSGTTVLTTYPANFTATMASALPNGFSGIYAGEAHDESVVSYLTPGFAQILQDFTAKSPMELDLRSCETSSNVSCATTVTGVGFSYNCQSKKQSLLPLIITYSNGSVSEPVNTFFSVGFDWSVWQLNITTLWKPVPEYTGDVLISQTCFLVPALVGYPVNVSQNEVTLQPSVSTINWTENHANIDPASQHVDKVIRVLPIPAWDAQYADLQPLGVQPGTQSTLGGIYLALSKLYTTSITIQDDITYAADINVDGSFAYSFALFDAGVDPPDFANNTFTSPMPQLLSNIREIMFRSSLAIVQRQIGNYATNSSSGETYLTSNDIPNSPSTSPGNRSVYHTVYKTNHTILTIAICLMTLSILSILPLYHGYWHLGRKVSLSPLELAKAFHTGTIVSSSSSSSSPPNEENEHDQDYHHHNNNHPSPSIVVLDFPPPNHNPHDGSNYDVKDLLKVLGSRNVMYGEITPDVLGFGGLDSVTTPMKGVVYR